MWYEKITERVILIAGSTGRRGPSDRRVKQEEVKLPIIVENDAGEEEDKEDDEGVEDERDMGGRPRD